MQLYEIFLELTSSYTVERAINKLLIEELPMKTKAAIITIGFVWFGTVYAMLFSSVGCLLTTIA